MDLFISGEQPQFAGIVYGFAGVTGTHFFKNVLAVTVYGVDAVSLG